MSRRLERVNELVKREISEIIRRDFSVSEFGLITVTGVEIGPDLKTGKIYFSVIGNEKQEQHALLSLQQRRGAIQSEMARTVILKYTPRLDFIPDHSGEHAERIMRVLEELKLPEEKMDAEESPIETEETED